MISTTTIKTWLSPCWAAQFLGGYFRLTVGKLGFRPGSPMKKGFSPAIYYRRNEIPLVFHRAHRPGIRGRDPRRHPAPGKKLLPRPWGNFGPRFDATSCCMMVSCQEWGSRLQASQEPSGRYSGPSQPWKAFLAAQNSGVGHLSTGYGTSLARWIR